MNNIYVIMICDNRDDYYYEELCSNYGYFTSEEKAREFVTQLCKNNDFEFFTQENKYGYAIVKIEKH